MCDQISDAILDACLAISPTAKVAIETAVKNNTIVLLGEISLYSEEPHPDYEAIARQVVRDIGYNDVETGMDPDTCTIVNLIDGQSPDIAQGVHTGRDMMDLGAGDQGMMFGYATNETPSFMPITYVLATKICKTLRDLRHQPDTRHEWEWLKPDAKTQVTVEYEIDGRTIRPMRVVAIVISTQHSGDISNEDIRRRLMQIVRLSVPGYLIDEQTVYHLNPSGRFVIGGPKGDAGLTGRKIIVDTYGGWSSHGGGCFSGKDCSKVDRSGAYAARWVAVSLVAAGLCRRCTVQLAYAIGVKEPVSIYIDDHGTSTRSDTELLTIVRENFSLSPGAIIRDLGLTQPKFRQTAAYGHFGRREPGFSWEEPKVLASEDQ